MKTPWQKHLDKLREIRAIALKKLQAFQKQEKQVRP